MLGEVCFPDTSRPRAGGNKHDQDPPLASPAQRDQERKSGHLRKDRHVVDTHVTNEGGNDTNEESQDHDREQSASTTQGNHRELLAETE